MLPAPRLAAHSRPTARVPIPTTTTTFVPKRSTSFVLTGENASYAGVTPAENFNPLVGTWGAFQVGFRYDGFKADNDAFVLGFAAISTCPFYAQSRPNLPRLTGLRGHGG